MSKGGAPRIVIVALLVVQLLFGVNYIAAKVVVDAFPPLLWASFRVIAATLGLFAIAFLSGRKPPKLDREFLLPLIGFSLLATVINQAAFLTGLHYTTATNSSILNTLIPIFTLMIVTLRGQERMTPRRLMGFLLAFLGVLIIRHVEDISISDRTLFGDALMIVNCLSFATFLAFSKKFVEKYDPLWITAWLFLYGSVGLSLLAIPSWKTFQMPHLTDMLIGSMAFTVIGGTLMTYLLNTWALSRVKSSSVALFIYLQPVVASVLAWMAFGERISFRTASSSLLIFLGMVLALQRAPVIATLPLGGNR